MARRSDVLVEHGSPPAPGRTFMVRAADRTRSTGRAWVVANGGDHGRVPVGGARRGSDLCTVRCLNQGVKEDWMSRTLLTSALTATALMLAMHTTQAQQSQQPSGQTQPAPPQQPPRQSPPEPRSQPPQTTPSSPTSQPPRGTTGEPQGTAAHKGMPSDATAFVNQMTIANLAEVQLGKLASERAINADVKSFGQMMVKDHSQANQDLAQVAAQLKVKPTTELDQKHKDLAAKLSKLQGAEFDREYISAMVQGHQEVAGQLEARAGTSAASATPGEGRSTTSESTPRTPTQSGGQIQGSNRTDGDQRALTEWAKRTLPAVQKHLARARELQSQVSK